MVYVDPSTGRRYAELSDFLSVPGASGYTISAMGSVATANYVNTGNGTSRLSFSPAPVFLGNGPAGSFITCGWGRRLATTTKSAAATQTYGSPAADDAERIARLKAFVLAQLGGVFADQVTTTTVTFATPVPGRIKVGDSYWTEGSGWQRVHPLFKLGDTTGHPADPDSILPHNPTVMTSDFIVSPATSPRWVRWLRFTQGSTSGEESAWQSLYLGNVTGRNVIGFPTQNLGPGAGTCYVRFTTLDGTGFTDAATALAGVGLSRDGTGSTDVFPYGAIKGVNGQTEHTINEDRPATFTIDAEDVRWTGDIPFRLQIRTAPGSLTETGNDWLTHPDVKLWTDVEVHPASDIGPELPATLEPLIADSLPRVTSRIRLRTGIDGGSP